MNPLKQLNGAGQSVWLDFIRRSLITSGDLNRLVDEDGVRGMTSNPTIFQNAIAGSVDYDRSIREALQKNPHADIKTLYEILAVEDIQAAADVLLPIYNDTRGADGYVSLEVSPDLARDTEGTIAEAVRLWETVNRPNLMIKVPATPEGVPALEELIARGINVNATLMFSLNHYEAIAQAYIRGLERCETPARVASVASFFVSRVDTSVDAALEAVGTPEALELRGKAAIANAKVTYERFREIFDGKTFHKAAARGARPQRPLWASTSTKNPNYRDVVYVEQLIGPDTVNTLPPATLNAFRDHGIVEPRLASDVEQAKDHLESLRSLGIDLDAVTEKLQVDGVASFAKSFEELLEALKKKRSAVLAGRLTHQSLNLGDYEPRVRARMDEWISGDFAGRLWRKDPSLWPHASSAVVNNRLGWLTLPRDMHGQIDPIARFAQEIRKEGFRHAVLLGMGGSSLSAEVFQSTLGGRKGFPELIVLDSTHPGAVRSVEDRIEIGRTLFIVSSKSGGTIETLSLAAYFWEKAQALGGTPGRNFIAITDSGSSLEALARRRGYRRIFEGPADVGGRFSALSVFGLVPAALIGVDIHRVLDGAWAMMEMGVSRDSGGENPALMLGAALAELAVAGRDKLTVSTSATLSALPVWIEQLVAESTGKEGRGIVPIVDEPARPRESYGPDRNFVHIVLHGSGPEGEDRLLELEREGHPVSRIQVDHLDLLGQEFLRWELAVSAAGAILGINPFDEPDVRSAKDLAKEAMQDRGSFGGKADLPLLGVGERGALSEAMGRWLESASGGDYVAVQAYLPRDVETHDLLQRIRGALGERTGLATTLGYGPRFLHSTGQIHKGGPNSGLFLQIVDDPVEDLPVPEHDYSLKDLITAQALGDAAALSQRGRRVIRVTLDREGRNGLEEILRLARP